jgi:electron transfer flavoprotein alpha subunit
MWGREVASRLAARLGAGLTGDAIGLEVQDGRLVAWKPAFGGQLVAAITAITDIQMVTLRPGAIPVLEPRSTVASVASLTAANRDRIRVLERRQDDQADALLSAWTVVGVGTGVPVEEYERLQPLLRTLQAELAATRKVTDLGWLPRSRQVGLTGHSISPRLYIGIGLSGNLNHQVGIRGAGTVLAINSDPKAPIFKVADVGILGDWREVVPLFVSKIRTQREAVLDEKLGVK